MAIKLMTLAFDTPFKATPKLLLMCLCDNANEEGNCFPSLKTLCHKSSISCSSIKYILNTFEKLDLITRTRRTRQMRKNKTYTSTLYQINTSMLTELSFMKSDEREKYLKEYDRIYKIQRTPKVKSTKQENKFKNFEQFKEFIFDEYAGKILTKEVPTYLEDTLFGISLVGNIYNNTSMKDLSTKQSNDLLKWLYENQDKML